MKKIIISILIKAILRISEIFRLTDFLSIMQEIHVEGALFFNVRASHGKGISIFILKDVNNFKTLHFGIVPDKKIVKIESLKVNDK